MFDEPPRELDKNRFATFLVGWALTQSGDTERGSHLLEQFIELEKREEETYGVDLAAVSVKVILNDTEDALEKLSEFSADPYFVPFYRMILERSSLFEPIRNEPEYIELFEMYEANATEQRQLLQEMAL